MSTKMESTKRSVITVIGGATILKGRLVSLVASLQNRRIVRLYGGGRRWCVVQNAWLLIV
eukprot:SAG31_NODE_3426_length_4289_cov_14.374702_3_plen_60_part_00